MRERDQQLYHLKRQGYEYVATEGDVELWAKPHDPDDVFLIRTNPPIPKKVLDHLIGDLEDTWDKPPPPITPALDPLEE